MPAPSRWEPARASIQRREVLGTLTLTSARVPLEPKPTESRYPINNNNKKNMLLLPLGVAFSFFGDRRGGRLLGVAMWGLGAGHTHIAYEQTTDTLPSSNEDARQRLHFIPQQSEGAVGSSLTSKRLRLLVCVTHTMDARSVSNCSATIVFTIWIGSR